MSFGDDEKSPLMTYGGSSSGSFLTYATLMYALIIILVIMLLTNIFGFWKFDENYKIVLLE